MAIGLQLLVQLGDARGEGFADETLSGFDRRSHPMGALVRLPQHVARPGEVALIGGQCHAPCESCRETQRRSPDGCGKAQCGCHSGGYGLIWVRLFWSDLIVPVRNCPATICGGGRGMAGVLQPATTCSNSSRDRPNTPAASLLLLRVPLAPLLSHALVSTPTNVAGRSPSNDQVRHKTPGHTRRRPHSRGAAPESNCTVGVATDPAMGLRTGGSASPTRCTRWRPPSTRRDQRPNPLRWGGGTTTGGIPGSCRAACASRRHLGGCCSRCRSVPSWSEPWR